MPFSTQDALFVGYLQVECAKVEINNINFEMLRKWLGSQKKNAAQLLNSINISKLNAQYLTEYSDLNCLLPTHNASAPALKYIIKDLKKEGFTPCYLLKCAVVVHFLFQNVSDQHHIMLAQFASTLMEKCNAMIEYLNNRTMTEPNESKSVAPTSCTTRDEGFWMGKTYFLLKQIIRPYLAYIQKFANFLKEDQKKQPSQREIWQIWRDINLLHSIHGFTNNFTIIGRYYLSQLGAFVVLLSETLSVDINRSYERIQSFISFKERLVCVHSHQEEEQREVQEFCRILEQIGEINQKFSAFYLGKYFYRYLQHIQQPKWIDINSKTFDRIFQGGNKENCQKTLKTIKSSKCIKGV